MSECEMVMMTREEDGCGNIQDKVIMEMKANFSLPENESDTAVETSREITFPEHDREATSTVVGLNNKIPKEKVYDKKHKEGPVTLVPWQQIVSDKVLAYNRPEPR